MPNQAEILKQKFEDSLGLPFAEVLSKDVVEEVLRAKSSSTTKNLHPRSNTKSKNHDYRWGCVTLV
jgi:hypothetical protein